MPRRLTSSTTATATSPPIHTRRLTGRRRRSTGGTRMCRTLERATWSPVSARTAPAGRLVQQTSDGVEQAAQQPAPPSAGRRRGGGGRGPGRGGRRRRGGGGGGRRR